MLADVWKPGCLRKGLPEAQGPAPPPDPGQAPTFCLWQLLLPRMDQLAAFWSPSWGEGRPVALGQVETDSEDSGGRHLSLFQFQFNSCTLQMKQHSICHNKIMKC